MYEHHKRAIENLKKYYEGDPEVLGVVLGGSVAKGLERPDSDIDGMVIVTPERYEKLKAEGRITECITGYCDYEGGYFDIKYMTKEYLEAAADHGSEPTRNSFLCSRCISYTDPEIPGIVERIPVFQKQEKQAKQNSFYAVLRYATGYFWQFVDDPILRSRTVFEIVHFALRMVMQDREVLYPCSKSMGKYIERMENKPPQVLELCARFVENPTTENMKSFVNYVLENIEYTPPKDFHEIGTQFVADNEQWWYKHRPFIAEW